MACTRKTTENSSAIEVLSIAKKHDIIAFRRKFYIHYAIYVGDEYVVEFGPVKGSPKAITIGVKGEVRKRLLLDVAEDSFCYIDDLKVEKEKLSEHEIDENIEKALSIREDLWYHIQQSNCEQFVTTIIFDTAMSLQVDQSKMDLRRFGSALAITGAFAGSTALAFTGAGLVLLPLLLKEDERCFRNRDSITTELANSASNEPVWIPSSLSPLSGVTNAPFGNLSSMPNLPGVTNAPFGHSSSNSSPGLILPGQVRLCKYMPPSMAFSPLGTQLYLSTLTKPN